MYSIEINIEAIDDEGQSEGSVECLIVTHRNSEEAAIELAHAIFREAVLIIEGTS